MKIKLNSIFVDDQQRIQLASPEGGDAELSLEPNVNPAAKAYQEALFEQGIPITAFEVDDLESEFRKLSGLGVAFTTEPMTAGGMAMAVFADTCGNLIQIYQPEAE